MSRPTTDLGVLPIACRFVSTDQWLVTHLSTSWSVSQVKQCLLDHFLSAEVRPPSVVRKQKRRALSPITFSFDQHSVAEPIIADSESDVDTLEGFEDDVEHRPFKYSPLPRLSDDSAAAPPQLPRPDAHSPGRYTLLAFSTGQILEDHFSLAWYGFRPHELLELHPRPLAAAALIMLPRGTIDAYIRPYFEARVWALRLVDAGVGDVVQLDVPRRGKGKRREREGAEDDGPSYDRRDRDRRRKKMEWRERWVVVHQGVFKLCKDRNDPSPAHEAPLSALMALHGAEQLHPNTPSSPALYVPSSPGGTSTLPPFAPSPRPSYAPSGTASAVTHETPVYGRTSEKVICAKFRPGPHPPPHSPAAGCMSGVPEERRGSDAGLSAGWWRRGSRDHTGPDTTAPRRGGLDGEDADEDVVWVVLDMRDEGAFTNILRILHRHAPATCVSSFAPHLSATSISPATTPEPGYSFPPASSLPPSSPPRTPSPIPAPRGSDVSHTSRVQRITDKLPSHSLPYPEWRLTVVRRARRAGLGAVGRAMELVMFGEEAVNDVPDRPADDTSREKNDAPSPTPEDGADTSAEHDEADTTAGDGDMVVWPARADSPARPPRRFGEVILDDNSDESSDGDSAHSASEHEWEGWTGDLVRQRAVHVRAEERRQRQREGGRRTPADDPAPWQSRWSMSWSGASASDEGTTEYDGSPQTERSPPELARPHPLLSYSSMDSPLWRTLHGPPSRSRSTSSVAAPSVSMPIPLPAYARPHSPLAQRDDDDVGSYFAHARRERAMSPPRALYSPRSFERTHGILMPIPMSMAMSTIRTSTVSVGALPAERGPRPRVPSLQWPTSPRSPVKGWGRRDPDKEKGKGKEKPHDAPGEGSWTFGQNLLRPARMKLSPALPHTPPEAGRSPVSAVTVTASLDSMKFVSPQSDG